MKKFLLFAIIFIVADSYGQTPVKNDTISFCFVKFKIPAGCKAASEFQVACNDYSMSWIYLTRQSLQTTPDQMISQMSGQLKKFRKEAITCYLFDNEVKGYKISFKTDQGTSHQLMAYGYANEQPVLVQLSLDKEPKTNEDIPAFPGQIIRLTK
jgi:hypothetical protein